jgi:succinyl-diaminopimelate desuccinylase
VIVDLQHRAEEDQASVVTLASELIRLPSRGGIDDYTPLLHHILDWLSQHGLAPRLLPDDAGRHVGVAVDVHGQASGPTWVLDACLDTAPFGDESAWTFAPTTGTVVDGWLRGRGAADSKLAAALFCHIAVAVARHSDELTGRLSVLLDADEHTGNFGGAKAFFAGGHADQVAGVMIGYPGLDHVIVGGRGVLRATLGVAGVAAHSGSSNHRVVNAITRAAVLIADIEAITLPPVRAGGIPLSPKLTVTGVNGGSGFSVVPDLCLINVDVRLTDQLGSADALELLSHATQRLDAALPGPRPTTIEVCQDWPPFQVADGEQPAAALLAGARAAGVAVAAKVAGPTNIGNYLAGLGIAATAGFGVPYVGLHGTDERVRLDALPSVHLAYHHAVLDLMGGLPGD